MSWAGLRPQAAQSSRTSPHRLWRCCGSPGSAGGSRVGPRLRQAEVGGPHIPEARVQGCPGAHACRLRRCGLLSDKAGFPGRPPRCVPKDRMLRASDGRASKATHFISATCVVQPVAKASSGRTGTQTAHATGQAGAASTALRSHWAVLSAAARRAAPGTVAFGVKPLGVQRPRDLCF